MHFWNGAVSDAWRPPSPRIVEPACGWDETGQWTCEKELLLRDERMEATIDRFCGSVLAT